MLPADRIISPHYRYAQHRVAIIRFLTLGRLVHATANFSLLTSPRLLSRKSKCRIAVKAEISSN
ncbi:MAG: hypothetical protein ACLP9L_36935, partial [Thermoguttaceae bacterium]